MFNSEPKHLPIIASSFHPGAMAHVPVTNADIVSLIPNSGLQVPFLSFGELKIDPSSKMSRHLKLAMRR